MVGDSRGINERMGSCQKISGEPFDQGDFMHNMFNFSSFNIVVNEMGGESLHAFRSILARDVNLELGWGSCPPLVDQLAESSAGISGLGIPSCPTINGMVTPLDFSCSPCRPLEECVSKICQEAVNE